MADLASVDPVAVCYDFLRDEAAVEFESVTGLDALEHVTGEWEPGWPHVVLTTGPGGDLRDLQWDCVHEVLVEVRSSPAGIPGEADLWRFLMQVATLLRSIPDRPSAPGKPVVTRVRPSGTLSQQTHPSGHLGWTIGLLVTVHPAFD